jgi:hypothetical protein
MVRHAEHRPAVRGPGRWPERRGRVVGEGNAGTFALYVQENYFPLIALNFSDTVSLDKRISAALHSNPYYQPVQVVPAGAGPTGPCPTAT